MAARAWFRNDPLLLNIQAWLIHGHFKSWIFKEFKEKGHSHWSIWLYWIADRSELPSFMQSYWILFNLVSRNASGHAYFLFLETVLSKIEKIPVFLCLLLHSRASQFTFIAQFSQIVVRALKPITAYIKRKECHFDYLDRVIWRFLSALCINMSTLHMSCEYSWSKPLSAPSFGRYWKQLIWSPSYCLM